MMKSKKILAALTAFAALTGSLSLTAFAEAAAQEPVKAEKTVASLVEKYFYDSKLHWELTDAQYAFLPADLTPVWLDGDGNLCTPEEAGWVASGYWYNENVYVDYANDGEYVYVNCKKSGAFYYKVKADNTVVILGRDDDKIAGLGGTMVIPEEIDGCPVTEIGNYAFCSLSYPNPVIEKIVIPDTVTVIGEFAFRNAVPSESPDAEINLPANIAYIGSCAFSNLGVAFGPVLKLPESLEVLHGNAFDDVTLSEIQFPASPFLTNRGFLAQSTDGDFLMPEEAYCWVNFDESLVSTEILVPNVAYCMKSLISLPGDVNDDNCVSIADLTLLSRYVAGDKEITLTSNGKRNADVNGDGMVDAMDIGLLAKQLASLS